MTSSYRENTIDWFNRDQMINFTFSQLRLKNQIKKLIDEGDDQIKITKENADGSIVGTMPLSYLKISRPHTRNLSTDQRKAVAERFKKAREESATITTDEESSDSTAE